MDNKLPIYIQVFQGDAPAQVSKFTQENVIIGSGPAAHLRLDDHRVSRIHAMLKVEASGQIKVSDLGWSDEGTILNGNKIAEEMFVGEGDQIMIGSTVLSVHLNVPGEQVAAPAVAASLDLAESSVPAPAPPAQQEADIFTEATEVMMSNPDPAFVLSSAPVPELPPAPAPELPPAPAPELPPAPVADISSAPEPAPAPDYAPVEPAQDVFSQSGQDIFAQPPVMESESPEALPPAPEAPAPVFAEEPQYAEPAPAYEQPAEAYQAPAPVAEPAYAQQDFVDNGPIPDDQLPPHVLRNMVQEDESKNSLEIRFLWHGTVVDVGHIHKPRTVTVGGHPLNDFSLSSTVFPEKKNFPLVVAAEGGYGAFFTEEFDGYVLHEDGSTRSITDMRSSLSMKKQDGMQGYVYAVQPGETLVLKAGDLDIEMNIVKQTGSFATSAYRNFDYIYWRIISASFIAHLALILVFQFFPRGTSALTEKILKGRFAKLIVVPPPEPPKRREKKFELKKKVVEKKKVKVDNSKKKVKEEGPVDQKTRDKQRVKNAGLLGLLNRGMGDMGPGGNLFGKAQSQQFLGKLLGASGAGAAFGMGFAGRGFGFGGGGGGGMYGGGSFGYGGRKRVYGRGGMNIRGRGKKKKMIRIAPGRLMLRGSLSKAQIARVVRMHWYQIRYCYESQLRKNPKLAGKVVVKWVIAGTGYVQTAAVIQTTMNNERVENCISRRVRRWKFPQPKGGGIVVVNYPFLFQVAGG